MYHAQLSERVIVKILRLHRIMDIKFVLKDISKILCQSVLLLEEHSPVSCHLQGDEHNTI